MNTDFGITNPVFVSTGSFAPEYGNLYEKELYFLRLNFIVVNTSK